MGKGGTLKKKMAFMPSPNNSLFGGHGFQAAAHSQLKETLSRRCDGIHILDSRDVQRALEEIRYGLSGQLDTLALGELGRRLGLGAVLEQTILDIDCISAKRGIWGLRKTRMLAQASFRLRCYDTETTAVLFDETLIGEVELSETAWKEARAAGTYNQEIAGAILSHMIPKIVSLVCEHLAEEPWKGYMVKDTDERWTLLAGRDVGLTPGDMLEIFGEAKPIRGYGAKVYLVPGPRIGEIRVSDVQENWSEAVPLSGGNLEKNHCVKSKP
jgi:hypothetical protein